MITSELEALLADRDSAAPENRVVRVMSERGAVSAAEIARRTRLARSTVSTALADLRRANVVVEVAAESGARGVGRPSALFALNPAVGTCVGLHFFPEEMRVLIADVSHSIIFETIVALGRDYSLARAAEAARRAVRSAYSEQGLSLRGLLGVGIAVPGPVAPDGRVQRASIVPTWGGANIREAFEPALERPIFADNESNCAAIAEMTWGAAVGCDDFVLFKIDVGVGGAIVHHGRVVTGVAGAAGEFGHMTIDPDGELCRCGNRGCLEIKASFVRPLELAARLHGRPLSVEDVVQLARAGDVGSARLIEDTAAVAGRGLGMIGAILNPGLIVVAGRVALAGAILLDPLRASYERHTLIKSAATPEVQRTRIVIGRFTENDSLMGAVGLVLRHHGRLS